MTARATRDPRPSTYSAGEDRLGMAWLPPDAGEPWADTAGTWLLERLPDWSLWALAALGAWKLADIVAALGAGR